MQRYKARQIALRLMAEFGLLEQGWRFDFFSQKTKAGECWERKRLIRLSRYYVSLNEESRVEDTIRHEIAHAIAGCWHGHDSVWKAKAVECGAEPKACLDVGIKVAEFTWEGRCPQCKKIVRRHKRSAVVCAQCLKPIQWERSCAQD